MENATSRRRGGVRSSVTKITTKITAIVDGNVTGDPSFLKIELEAQLDRLVRKEEELLKLDREIESEIDDDQLDAERAGVELYEEKIALAKAQASAQLRPVIMASQSSAVLPASQTGNRRTLVKAKLPKLELRKFWGKIEEWQPFWELFQATVENNPDLSDVEKLSYLVAVVQGSAAVVISGLPITGANYTVAVNILKERFGRPDRIRESHLRQLLELKPIPSHTTFGLELRNLYDICQAKVRALEALGVGVSEYEKMLQPALIRLLPVNTQRDWCRQVHQKIVTDDLTGFLKFLKGEVEGWECVKEWRSFSKPEAQPNKEASREALPKPNFRPTTSTFVVGAQESKVCAFCQRTNHKTVECFEVKDPRQRRKLARSKDLCYCCLASNHKARECDAFEEGCVKCQQKHHASLCIAAEKSSTRQAAASNIVTASVVGHLMTEEKKKTSHLIQLQTAQVWVEGDQGWFQTRMLLDGGSQRSFIASSLSAALRLPVGTSERLQVHAFGQQNVRTTVHKTLKVRIVGLHGGPLIELQFLEVPQITSAFISPPTPKQVEGLRQQGLQPADLAHESNTGMIPPIELLIGADNYWRVVLGPVRRFGEALVATESAFGWVLHGEGVTDQRNEVLSSFHIAVQEDMSCEDYKQCHLERLWELDAEALKDLDVPKKWSSEECQVHETFKQTIKHENGRYVVNLPWGEKSQFLEDNYIVARTRLKQLLGRLRQNRDLWERYNTAIETYLNDGHAEEVPNPNKVNGPVYYVPHHAVIRENRVTTKLRVVFDASSHQQGYPSLNDCLNNGPNLNPEIPAMLLRFRGHKIAFASDLEKAFLQVGLAKEDRDASRFLWVKPPDNKQPEKLRTLRMTRVFFGAKPSPYLLASTVRFHAEKLETQSPEVSNLLQNDLYVDDLLAGAETDEEAFCLYKELQESMKKASMTFKKWVTNSDWLREQWTKGAESQYPFKEVTNGKEPGCSLKVLGLRWESRLDVFQFASETAKENAEEEPTKRMVLREAAQLFDPLGFLAPLITAAKILLQIMWQRGLTWDEAIPDDLKKKWKRWKDWKVQISELSIQRCIFSTKETGIQLHVFCDASQQAYGSVAYLRVQRGEQIEVSLAISRSRVAPLRRVTLPRLELLGAVTGARLSRYVTEALKSTALQIFLWTDAKVVLGWVKSDDKTWKAFVGNRVAEIQRLTQPSQWRHCPGQENPADVLTREDMVSKLFVGSLWWQGPRWLKYQEEMWPEQENTNKDYSLETKAVQEELRQVAVHQLLVNQAKELVNWERFSRYFKLLRAIVWVFRFIHCCRTKVKCHLEITADEIRKAEIFVVQQIQEESFSYEVLSLTRKQKISQRSKLFCFRPFLDNNNILRVGSRLEQADLSYETKFPILLPAEHPVSTLIIRHAHQRIHHGGVVQTLSEVRSRFWLLRGRVMVKKALHGCVTCQRISSVAAQQTTGPLPSERIEEMSKPFQNTGIDFAGPLWVRGSDGKQQKAYLLLCTCAVTRAVHLELTSDRSTEQVILALRRFFARRGVSEVLFSDNAKEFKRADMELHSLYRSLKNLKIQDFSVQQGTRWKFIVERAAWWGGFWERLVQTVKRAIRKTLGRANVTYIELETIIVEVEATLNSRPLTYLSADPKDLDPLTPAHLLVGYRLKALPSGLTVRQTELESAKVLTRRWRYRLKLTNDFWKRWRKEYLLELRTFHQSKDPAHCHSLKPDSLVVIEDSRLPRHLWKFARVISLFEGRDGKVRSCLLRTGMGPDIKRPVQLLYPLEC